MNKEQLKQDIEVMEQRLASMKAELNKKPVSKVFIPKNGCDYFFIGADNITRDTYWSNDDYDNGRIAIVNCYRTLEDAQKARDKQLAYVRITRKLRELEGDLVADWGDSTQSKHYFYYDTPSRQFLISFHWTSIHHNKAMYSTKEACEWVIANMADDLKLIFEV